MTLKEFKTEFRLICTDTWGTAMDAWFECAGHMLNRGLDIPYEWEYSAGMGDGREEDSYFYTLFLECTNEQLHAIGNFLFRYCEMLRYAGVNY